MKGYQEKAAGTLNGLQVHPSENQLRLVNFTLGLTGESGELQEAWVECVSGDELVGELGDCCWYAAAICTVLGQDFDNMWSASRTQCHDGRVGDWISSLEIEAARVANLVKKHVFHRHTLKVIDVVTALKRYLVVVHVICLHLNIDADEMLQANLDKLAARYGAGFSFKASINRVA